MRRILIACIFIAAGAIATHCQRDGLTPDAPKVMTPIAFRHEYCYVRPGMAAGPKTGASEGGTWERLVNQIGNEGREMTGQGPDEKGVLALWLRRGRWEHL